MLGNGISEVEKLPTGTREIPVPLTHALNVENPTSNPVG